MAFGVSRLFSSTDTSAPVLNLTAGGFKNLLKAVLVNGYGSTPSLGWTLEYEVGNVAVFRMKGGTRYYIRVDDNNVTGSEYTDSISGFKTVFDVNNGTERVPVVGAASWFRKRVDGTANVPWMIIGDDAGIIVLTKPSYVSDPNSVLQNLWKVCYFGDYIPLDVRNKWNFCIISSFNTSGAACGIYRHGPSSSVNHYVQRDHSFKIGPSYCGIAAISASTNFGQGHATPTGGIGTASCKIGGNFLTTPVLLYTNMLGANTASSNCFVGALPGISEPIMTDGESSSYIGISAISPVIINTTDYQQQLLYTHNGSSSDNSIRYIYSSKLVFKIGKGFRNV